ncbi:MAG: efflux RND transporter periplasmic adaptor subunit [Labilithrix sp.]|nr:efflux RND transporter periplasmic adaptor subunit [Labilithrix sp.]MCW5812842.1 efflux RND transporter periplasmic adaptor subunit [Labilithrix sp.]
MPRRALVLLLLFFFACLGACSRRDPAEEPAHVRRSDRSVVLSDASAAWVRVERARTQAAGRTRSFAGRVAFDERRVARVGPAVGGRVSSVSFVRGDEVKKGDVLLTVYAPDVTSAQAQLTQAKTARSLAERAAARARTLVRDGAGSDAERESAESALASAVTEEARAAAALAAIGGAAGPTGYALRSPIAGRVIEKNVAVGAQVTPGGDKPLFTIGDLGTVWIVADVFEQDLAAVKEGAEATIQVLALKGRTWTGAVTQLSSVVDPGTRAVEARIELPNADGALRPGMTARVFMRGAAGAGAEVPAAALLARRDQFFVFVRHADGSFREREVQVAGQYGEHATIASGLQPGEEVVTEGAILLDAEVNEAL